MTIRTKQSLSGFVATDPELTFTSNGDARVYMRIGQPQARFEQDGTFTQLDPEFTDLVMFRKSAELAHEQFELGAGGRSAGHKVLLNRRTDRGRRSGTDTNSGRWLVNHPLGSGRF